MPNQSRGDYWTSMPNDSTLSSHAPSFGVLDLHTVRLAYYQPLSDVLPH